MNRCSTCTNKKFRNKNYKKIYAIIGTSCSICGYDKCSNALEFHHINPFEKEYTIAQILNRNINFIKQELDKCILICANCHRQLHENDIGLYTVLTKQQLKAKENYEMRKSFIMQFKTKCKNCGYNNSKAALEFHHRNPETKLFQISESHFRKLDLIKAEIDKCDVLCANCHRELHS